MADKSNMEMIQNSILDKACMKQDVFSVIKHTFEEFKSVLAELEGELKKFTEDKDQRIEIALKNPASGAAELYFGSDLLVFHMHTNVFTFPHDHMIYKNPYVKKDPKNGYVGVINVYNFLADSYRYHRMNDSGYLVARIFVNHERHFFVEGKRQLGFLYNDFANATLDREGIRAVLESCLLYAIDFDLYTPPYNHVKEVTVSDLTQLAQYQSLKTGKRLGFRFQAELDNTEF